MFAQALAKRLARGGDTRDAGRADVLEPIGQEQDEGDRDQQQPHHRAKAKL